MISYLLWCWDGAQGLTSAPPSQELNVSAFSSFPSFLIYITCQSSQSSVASGSGNLNFQPSGWPLPPSLSALVFKEPRQPRHGSSPVELGQSFLNRSKLSLRLPVGGRGVCGCGVGVRIVTLFTYLWNGLVHGQLHVTWAKYSSRQQSWNKHCVPHQFKSLLVKRI